MKKLIYLLLVTSMILVSCQNEKKEKSKDMENPFFGEWTTPHGVPPFEEIKLMHYLPAIEQGMQEQNRAIDEIVSSKDEPTFENTIYKLDKSDYLLDKVTRVFFPLSSANTSEEMQAEEKKIIPMLTKHRDNIAMNEGLFKKIKAVYEKRNELGLDKEQMRATEKYYEDFVRNGADLNQEDQTKLKKLNEKLSTLNLEFGENLLAETNKNFKLVIDDEKDLAGLPDDVIARAADDAEKANEAGKWVFTLAKPSMLPFLQFAESRALREKLYRGYFMRGDNDNANDNKKVIKKMIKLRQERANLLGYDSHAAYVIDANMAKTPQVVYNFLDKLMKPAMKNAQKDLKAMQAIANKAGADFKLQPWDWWFYAEKLRKEKYNLDESEIKPYFTLENARNGIFYLTNQLFGITFNKKADWPTYHKEAEAYEVLEKDGSFLGVLYMDFHPRDGKTVGAWSTSFRDAAYDKEGNRIPAIGSIVMNFTRPAGNQPAFLSFDELTTFFHEFGHALHGLFTDGPYERTAGDVARDFVEFPSQVMENWAAEPSVMKEYAKHYQTGEVIPDELIEKMQKAGTFNEGFNSGEYLAAAYLDMFYHDLKDGNVEDIRNFEEASMEKIGLIPEILPRYRSTYFSHIFDGGYSAGYYVYIWAAVLDADAFQYFKDSGDVLNPEIAKKYRELLARSGSADGMEIYKKFRGQEPSIEPLLKRRGFDKE